MDPATFRVTVLVFVRFISLQRQVGSHSDQQDTVQTGEKLVIPSVFFFLFVLLFAGVFYTAESGTLYKCPAEIEAQMENGWVHRKFMEPDWPTSVCDANATSSSSACCKYCVEANPLAGRDVINEYDGSCKLLVVKSDDTITYTMIEDMFDAMWTIIITMTTVGYGGKYPRTMTGKLVAVVSAILGSLYMAMPLTIVGNRFYDVYLATEQERSKALYKSAQILHKKNIEKKAERNGALGRSSSFRRPAGGGTGLNLKHVVSLKRWVKRTKRSFRFGQALRSSLRCRSS